MKEEGEEEEEEEEQEDEEGEEEEEEEEKQDGRFASAGTVAVRGTRDSLADHVQVSLNNISQNEGECEGVRTTGPSK